MIIKPNQIITFTDENNIDYKTETFSKAGNRQGNTVTVITWNISLLPMLLAPKLGSI